MQSSNQTPNPPESGHKTIDEDIHRLHALGYAQELLRRMSGFSNFAISFSIICILAGGVTSFPLGLSSVGGAAIGLGWPLACLLSLCFAAAMAQLASAFPTAGGLYHWASILGGKGLGWVTAWFNLIGLITVLSAINVGTYQFIIGSIGPAFGLDPSALSPAQATLFQAAGVGLITVTQAIFNHWGIRATTLLTDFSGYLIFAVATLLTIFLFVHAPALDISRLWTFSNNSGAAGGEVWPQTQNIPKLFFLGLLLPAYTVTGFDASAHTSEETIGAAVNVPKAILRAVLYSGIFGWLMLIAVVLAAPDLGLAASKGSNAFYSILDSTLAPTIKISLYIGIALAQYLCGLATVTSASRMTYAFARDGGLPASSTLRTVSPAYRSPVAAVWTVALLSIAFTIYTPVYSTITAVCTIFLYISYGIPIALGLWAYNRTWKQMGPWSMGGSYRVVASICVLWCIGLLYIGVQPPNDKALYITLGFGGLTALVWFGAERKRFVGPPSALMTMEQRMARNAEIQAAEQAVGQKPK